MSSVTVLQRDLKSVLASSTCQSYGIELVQDNIRHWRVTFPSASFGKLLRGDLDLYARRYGKSAAIVLEMEFPNTYPVDPPFVHVVRPRFQVWAAPLLGRGRALSEVALLIFSMTLAPPHRGGLPSAVYQWARPSRRV
jgi:hypothetical protein